MYTNEVSDALSVVLFDCILILSAGDLLCLIPLTSYNVVGGVHTLVSGVFSAALLDSILILSAGD